jgi:hypothetical protein
MNSNNRKKSQQLGINFSTATHRLKKLVMFDLVQKTFQDTCFRCGQKIKFPDELSVEHKEAWLDSPNPVDLFFNLNNLAFSHLTCNTASARRTNKKYHTLAERHAANLKHGRESMKKWYTTEKRRQKKLRTGY